MNMTEINTEEMSDAELEFAIRTNFEVMTELTELLVGGHVQSLIVSGASGIGKSFEMIKRLDQAVDNGEIESFKQLKGDMSAVGLYAALYENRHAGCVLVLDDLDVFDDKTSLDLLKAVLDTNKTKEVSWNKASSWLEKQGIPNDFSYQGTCVFLTNIDFNAEINRKSSLTPHLKAFLGRCSYLDLGIHTNKAVLVRIKQVLTETSMAVDNDITEEEQELIIEWLEMFQDQLSELSLRTVLKIAGYMAGSPSKWIDIAEVTLLRNQSM
jgi:hypothetical protein